jgi:hypothetical protein
MALRDRLRKGKGRPRTAEPPPDPVDRDLVGPGVLRPDQLRIIERVLEIESPSSTVPPPPAPPPPPPPPLAPARRAEPEPLPTWKGEWVDLEPDAEPVLEPVASAAPLDRSDPCPNCGEEARVGRVDLTANAGWMTCQACGLRWGGAIDRSDDDRERGEAIAG